MRNVWPTSGAKSASPSASRAGRFSSIVAPLHEPVDPAIFHLAKAQSFVEAERWVHALDMDAQRLAGGARLVLEVLEQPGPDALAAVRGQQRDVHQPDLV